ncbi:hypothetical protein GOP47_0020163 [Adiantum capillus-veneris]|uniref:Uncharacterized protein n=1 Tax=Adiantum capillus-veneris TaxID=13818 RepID=A0A9D4Z7R8_ADICA|nr:hypothetical protein GOP47_0020163 [Adiantum capillus-veneris]
MKKFRKSRSKKRGPNRELRAFPANELTDMMYGYGDYEKDETRVARAKEMLRRLRSQERFIRDIRIASKRDGKRRQIL